MSNIDKNSSTNVTGCSYDGAGTLAETKGKVYSKADKRKVCRYVLYNTKSVVNENHANWLINNVFMFHPEWDEKQGVGIDHLEVGSDGYGGKCFYIIQTDGWKEDISFEAALRPRSKKSYINKACRTAVLPIKNKIRDNIEFPFTCPITGEVITDINGIHIDHYDEPFDTVFNMWLEDKDIDVLYNSTNKQASGVNSGTHAYFVDKDIIADFIDFHNKHTHLRAVSKRANLSDLRKKK